MELLQQYAPQPTITSETTLDELGLSSLYRVELMVDLEQWFYTSIDESLLTGARTISALTEINAPPSPADIPTWSRLWPARLVRTAALNTLWLPLNGTIGIWVAPRPLTICGEPRIKRQAAVERRRGSNAQSLEILLKKA